MDPTKLLKCSPDDCYWRLEREHVFATLTRIEAKLDQRIERTDKDHDALLVLRTKWAMVALFLVFVVNALFVFLKWMKGA